MTTRPLRDSDVPKLRNLAAASGYPYPAFFGPLIETTIVVVDDANEPIMAVTAQRLVELYLYTGNTVHPAVKLHALRLLHEAVAAKLREKGYASAEVFLPPTIASTFGRRLTKSFGWVKNWVSYTRTF